jgi:hypothetical protein
MAWRNLQLCRFRMSGSYFPVAVLNLTTSSAGTRPRSLTPRPCFFPMASPRICAPIRPLSESEQKAQRSARTSRKASCIATAVGKRWNLPEGWGISRHPAHAALVSEADFITVQQIEVPRVRPVWRCAGTCSPGSRTPDIGRSFTQGLGGI